MSGVSGGGGVFSKYEESGEFTMTTGSQITFSHNWGKAAKGVELLAICKSSNINYAVGDVIRLGMADSSSGNRGFTIVENGLNSVVAIMPLSTPLIPNKTSGSHSQISTGSWRVKIRCWT